MARCAREKWARISCSVRICLGICSRERQGDRDRGKDGEGQRDRETKARRETVMKQVTDIATMERGRERHQVDGEWYSQLPALP